MCGHYRIDGIKITEIGQRDIDFDGSIQLTAGGLSHSAQIFEDLRRFCRDIAGDHFHGFWNQWYLTGNPNRISDLDPLRIGADGLWGRLSGDDGSVGHHVLQEKWMILLLNTGLVTVATRLRLYFSRVVPMWQGFSGARSAPL